MPAPRARGMVWLGLPTPDVDASIAFFRDRLGLEVEVHDGDFVVLRLPGGETVELFGPSLSGDPQFAAGAIVGFEVDDVAARRAELEAEGVRFIGPIHHGDGGRAWTHFHGPDDRIYELTQLSPEEAAASSSRSSP